MKTFQASGNILNKIVNRNNCLRPFHWQPRGVHTKPAISREARETRQISAATEASARSKPAQTCSSIALSNLIGTQLRNHRARVSPFPEFDAQGRNPKGPSRVGPGPIGLGTPISSRPRKVPVGPQATNRAHRTPGPPPPPSNPLPAGQRRVELNHPPGKRKPRPQKTQMPPVRSRNSRGLHSPSQLVHRNPPSFPEGPKKKLLQWRTRSLHHLPRHLLLLLLLLRSFVRSPMDLDMWRFDLSASSRSHRSACKSRYDAAIVVDEFDGEGDLEVYYPCPYCSDDYDLLELCLHIEEEHPVEADFEVCPVCAAKVEGDIVEHITTKHSDILKISFFLDMHQSPMLEKDKIEKAGRCEFLQGLVMSSILDFDS
ncbi:hypothetical protein NL676_022366 [Syzygium grande]|nr:hypothetical protein NL676_022366 [Syzygium grande]